MKKFLISLILAALLVTPVFGAYTKKSIQLQDEYGNPITNVYSVTVYPAGRIGSPTTLYKDSQGNVSVTNPITTSSTATTLTQHDGRVWWYSTGGNYKLLIRSDVDIVIDKLTGSDTRVMLPAASIPPQNRLRGFLEDCKSFVVGNQDDGTAASGTATERNVFKSSSLSGGILEMYIGATSSVLLPPLVTGGWSIEPDATNDEHFEYTNGITAESRSAFIIGTDGAFFTKARFSIADVSGTDDCAIGFRKVGAYQVAGSSIDDYSDMCVVNIISGVVYTETILNSGTTTSTTTTIMFDDNESKDVEVKVSAAGVASVLVNGVAPSSTWSFTFDDADVVIPFFFIRQASDLSGEIILREWQTGIQK